MKKRTFLALFLCGSFLVSSALGGCARERGSTAETEEVIESGYVGMAGDAPDLDYEVIAMSPSVLVDQIGYEPGSTKVVLFRGSKLEDSFHVVDAETGSTIFTGTIQSYGPDEETGETLSYGNFTGLVEEGSYYIKTGIIGESYPFTIDGGLYRNLFREVCASYEERWYIEDSYQKSDLMVDVRTISNLLIAYEYYTGNFTDDLGIAESGNGVPDILDMIRRRVESILTLELSELDSVQLLSYSGILGQFYQDYKNADAAFAMTCLRMAEEAYRMLLQRNSAPLDTSYVFYAAAQLYRATGYYSYHATVRSYLNGNASGGSMDFYGKMAYLSSKGTVDSALCNNIMTEMMESAEQVSAVSEKDAYLVCSRSYSEICAQMLNLAAVNYVITNHEYLTVQENHLHYLLGRNPDGVSLIAGTGQVQAQANELITSDSEESAALIFMMCEIVLGEMEDKN